MHGKVFRHKTTKAILLKKPVLHRFFATNRFYFIFISSVSLTSHSIDTCKAFASISNSASQTCRWFFSIREMIRGVISSMPIN